MEVGQVFTFPPGAPSWKQKSSSFILPIHRPSDFVEYGKIVSFKTTGNFNLYISLDPTVPPYYSHTYHYYHQSTSPTGPTTQRLQYNPQTKVVEVYSFGPQLDIIMPTVPTNTFDTCFNKYSHSSLYIAVHDVDSEEGQDPVPISLSPLFLPRPMTQSEYESYLKQCTTGNMPQDLSSPQKVQTNTTATVSMENLFHLYSNNSSDDDDEDGERAPAYSRNVEDFDDDFASSDDEATPAPDTPSPQASSPNTKMCQICSTAIPTAQFEIHHLKCSERHQFCDICHLHLPKAQFPTHVHCDVCNIITTPLFLNQHVHLYHNPVICECLAQQFKEHRNLGLPLESFDRTQFIFPYLKLQPHRAKECIFREMSCAFCHKVFKEFEINDHQDKCGNSEYQCVYCDRTIALREKNGHLLSFHRFPSLHQLPDPEEWRKDHLYADTSAEIALVPGTNNNALHPYARFMQRDNQSTEGGPALRALDPDDRITVIESCYAMGLDPFDPRHDDLIADLVNQLL